MGRSIPVRSVTISFCRPDGPIDRRYDGGVQVQLRLRQQRHLGSHRLDDGVGDHVLATGRYEHGQGADQGQGRRLHQLHDHSDGEWYADGKCGIGQDGQRGLVGVVYGHRWRWDGTLAYDWNWGDGSAHTTGTLTPSHTYADNGRYTVTLTVTDANNAVGTDTAVVTVSNVAPTATVSNNGPVARMLRSRSASRIRWTHRPWIRRRGSSTASTSTTTAPGK